MKPAIRIATAALVGFVTLLGFAPTAQAAQCSLANTAAKWSFTANGFLVAGGTAVPVGAVGNFTQDLGGSITGSQTRSLGGNVANETLAGTAVVNADCTGTDTFQVFVGNTLVRTTTIHVQYTDHISKARAIFTSLLPAGSSAAVPVIITAEASRE
jgi:hypothetical protein